MFTQFFKKERTTQRHLFILAGVVLLAFGPSLAGNVLGDDVILLRTVRTISWSPADLSQEFRWGQEDFTNGWMPEEFDGFVLQYFRPVFVTTLKIDYALWGTWTPGYHLTNLIFYLLIVFLVYTWGADFGIDKRGQLLLGVLFILYTPNQMTVNLVNSRTELVAAVFILASVISLGRFYAKRNPLFYLAAIFSGILAFGSKENAVMLPLLHCCAAAFLYPPRARKETHGVRLRILSILPFFVMLPVYFYLRDQALGGFPIPLKGFYFHHPADPGFAAFLLSKISHAVIALVYQVPAVIMPLIIERSMPILTFAVLWAVVTLIVAYRWMKPPFRYFLITWAVLSLAPSMPFGLNPIYYFVCSPVIVLFYVFLYRAFADSPVAWQAKLARRTLTAALIYGLVVCAGLGIAARFGGQLSRDLAQTTIDLLDENAEVEEVFFLDMPPAASYLIPTIRYQAEAHADKKYYVLSFVADVLETTSSEIIQQDATSFDLFPGDRAFLKSGIEEVMLAREIEPYQPGMIARHPEYEMEIIEVESDPIADEDGFINAVRHHFKFPPKGKKGVLDLRYRFNRPLASPDRLFLKVVGTEVEKVEFY